MKQLYFNELSIFPLAQDFYEARLRVDRFINTFKCRPTEIFETRICCEHYIGNIQLTSEMDLQTFCKDPRSRTLGSLLLGLTKHPYIVPDSIQEDQFLVSDFLLQKDGEEIFSYGLTAAFLHESVGIGFASESFWNNVVFKLKDAKKSEFLSVLCISSSSHFQSSEFLRWREEKTPVEIIRSDLSWDQKKIHLRDDHGNDVLRNFAKRVVRSPYVIAGDPRDYPPNSESDGKL